MLEMNPEIRKRWCEALRSGRYAQTQQELKDNVGFCCLGVLEDLRLKEVGGKWETGYLTNGFRPSDSPVDYDSYIFLTAAALDWAGLDDNNPGVDGIRLSILNDDYDTDFGSIADLIEGKARWDDDQKILIYPD